MHSQAALSDLTADSVEFVGILDADHIASAGFLTAVLPYSNDPVVALVQTPQDFYNLDFFEHIGTGESGYSEQALFYRVLSAGRNRWKAAFWCGTGALDGSPMSVTDIRLTGARLTTTSGTIPQASGQVLVDLGLAGAPHGLPGTVRRVSQGHVGTIISIEFTDCSATEQVTLANALFATGITPASSPQTRNCGRK